MSRVIALLAACFALALPARASYFQDVWNSEYPAGLISDQLNDIACTYFGMGLNCSTAGVKDAFEGSSFDRAAPSLTTFNDWFDRNARPVLHGINAPVQRLRSQIVEALERSQSASAPGDDVSQQKETSLRRQLCESRGGSKLYCQKMNTFPWDARSGHFLPAAHRQRARRRHARCQPVARAAARI